MVANPLKNTLIQHEMTNGVATAFPVIWLDAVYSGVVNFIPFHSTLFYGPLELVGNSKPP